MLNRPEATWLNNAPNRTAGWETDRAPKLRLLMLWAGIALPLLAVAVRMGQLQILLRDDFAGGFEQTYVELENIPARDGRILAADGGVLAGDEEQYDLQVHYQLIQEPADKSWQRAEARRYLSPVERKSKPLVEAEMERVLDRRRELWTSISHLTGRDPQELEAARLAVQKRIEQVRAAVLRKRAERLEQAASAANLPSVTSASGWQAIWNMIQRELTEPPDRSVDPGLIREETDYHTVAQDVGAEIQAEVEAHPRRYPGVRILVRTRRTYPLGELASHVIGSRRPLTAEEYAERRAANPAAGPDDYREGDPIGRSGLELKYESHLHGVHGVRRLIKNRRGEVVDVQEVRPPRHGSDLVLTIDLDVQRRAEQMLDEAQTVVTLPATVEDESNRGTPQEPTCPQGGCLVALDVYSGAVLAAASAPRFDVNLLVHPDRKRWDDLMADRRKPFFRRVTEMKLPPGSVFKIISAVAAIESGKVDPAVPIHCRGYLDRPDQYRCAIYRQHQLEHGNVRLTDALCVSCNVYFFTAARRMGPGPLIDWAGRFGLGSPTGIDLPSEEVGRLPEPDASRLSQTLGLAIGQADLLVTPLQMARVIAAVANDGSLVTPHLASDVGPVSVDSVPKFRPVFSHPDPKPIEGLHPETLQRVREGLDMVVNNSSGTAFKYARMKSVRMAGKTGTAENNAGADHAWFAGYVPADRPRFAFVVVLEHGGSGGRAAGPVARKFVECLLDMGLVTNTTDLAGEQP